MHSLDYSLLNFILVQSHLSKEEQNKNIQKKEEEGENKGIEIAKTTTMISQNYITY